jgi:putative nucleotidyltransferase with HDIG domain
MAVPDRSTARRLLSEQDLPGGIVVHSEGVARVAVAAAGLVAEAQIPVDGALVEAAALLHDIDKVEIRRTGGEHGVVGARRLEALGYEELAMPVASHPITALLDDDRFPIGWPSVLLAVADRHVAQEFLTVDERLDDMKNRHPEHAASIEAARRPAHALEEELAEVTGLSVDDLVARLRAAWEAGT